MKKNTKKRSSQKNNAQEYLANIQEYVGGELKISKRKVPHLVINDWFSICYFATYDFFKVFSGYGTIQNKRLKNFKSWEEVVAYFHYEMNFPWAGEKTLRNYLKPCTRFELMEFYE